MISGALLPRTRGYLPYIGGSLPHMGARLATSGRGGSEIGDTLSQICAALSNMRHGLPAPCAHISAVSNVLFAPVETPLFRDGELVRIL
jgi:hypothetical protein